MKYTNNIPGITLEAGAETCLGKVDKALYRENI